MPSRSAVLATAASPSARPRRRLLARGGAALVAAATSLGTLIALEGTAMAEPVDCGSITSGPQLLAALSAPEHCLVGSEYRVTLGGDQSVIPSAGLEWAGSLPFVLDLNGKTLKATGSSVDPGTDGRKALTVQGTLHISGGKLDLVGGAGGDGMANGGTGGTALSVRSGAILELVDVALTATGGTGGDADGEVGTGGDGAKGVTNEGTIRLGGTSSFTAYGGSGGNGYNAGSGNAAVLNDSPSLIIFDHSDVDVAAVLQHTDGSPGTSSGGGEGGVVQGVGTTSVLLDGNGVTSPSRLLVYAYSGLPLAPVYERLDPWPSREGYTFDGWFDAAGSGGRTVVGSTTVGDLSGTVYAHWTPVDGDDGDDNGGDQTSSVTSSVETTEPTTSTTTPVETTTTAVPTTSPAPTTQTPTSTTPVPTPLPTGTDAADLGVDDPTPGQGGRIVLTAQGFQPGSVVDFWIHSTPVYLGSAVADSEGVATLPVVLDKQYVGVHHVQAVGVGPDGQVRNVAQQITVSAPPALAETGPVTWPLLLLALELLAAGVALNQWQQRDRRSVRTHR